MVIEVELEQIDAILQSLGDRNCCICSRRVICKFLTDDPVGCQGKLARQKEVVNRQMDEDGKIEGQMSSAERAASSVLFHDDAGKVYIPVYYERGKRWWRSFSKSNRRRCMLCHLASFEKV
jgi:16S rRNA U516 pseudouridylate synthase RsuA-like enzyme